MPRLKQWSLAIVQSHATQFDGPLFRLLGNHPNIDLTVYYLKKDACHVSYDPELGRESGWDHDVASGYQSETSPTSIRARARFINNITRKNRHHLVIVAGYNSVMTLLIAIYGKLCGTPIGIRADSTFIHREASLKWKIKDMLLPLVYRLYTTGHPTGTLAGEVMQYYGMPKDALFRFPYSVDHDYISGLREASLSMRDERRGSLGIGKDDFVIIGVMKFIPREDPLTLLYAYRKLAKDHPQVHLVLVGDGPQMGEIRDYIREHDLNNVHLTGYLPYSELPGDYAMANVFVHPARIEPWGVSVNEAMVCGLPVIVADTVGAGRDLVEEGKTGYVYPAGDFGALSNRIELLINANKSYIDSLSENVRGHISNWDYASTQASLFQSLQYVTSREVGHE